jgi:hypothetical protein
MADPTEAAFPKKLLIVAHAPSPNTLRLCDALVAGARELQIEGLEVQALGPFQTHPENVFAADAIILLTPENLGYMSGALKDFFDRIYYPCLERTQGLPYALCVRAGSDGAGTRRAVESIATGLRWRKMQEAVICRGEWRDEFLADCREMAMRAAAGLDAGVF